MTGQPVFLPGSIARSSYFRQVSVEGAGGRTEEIMLTARFKVGEVCFDEDRDLLVFTRSTVDYAVIGRDIISRYVALFHCARGKAKLSDTLWARFLSRVF
jgi:hypothetical protein